MRTAHARNPVFAGPNLQPDAHIDKVEVLVQPSQLQVDLLGFLLLKIDLLLAAQNTRRSILRNQPCLLDFDLLGFLLLQIDLLLAVQHMRIPICRTYFFGFCSFFHCHWICNSLMNSALMPLIMKKI